MHTTIGRYRVLGEVARGGMGAVLRAVAPDGREVALKLLLAGRGASARQRRRFQGEAQALVKLRHPGVVPLLDAGEHEGVPFLALEWITGESLEARLARRGPLEPLQTAALGLALARALLHCHAQGVLHRDVKPGNVLIRDEDGAALLTDFGLAKELLDARSLGETRARTLEGAGLGTPGFWPPEQARGELDRIGPRSDVYGLGATLYAALTGRPPHEGEDLLTLLAALERPPPPPSALAPGVPPALDAVCARCLQLDPDRRYPDMAALARDLAAIVEGRPLAFPGSRRMSPLVLGLALVLVLVLVLGLLARPGAAPAAPPPPEPRPAPASRPPPPDPGQQAAAIIAAVETSRPSPVSPPQSEAARLETQRGIDLARAGESSAALACFERAMELDPGAHLPWYSRGLTRLGQGDLSGALADFTRTVVLEPAWPNGWQNRAGARERMNDLAGAAADLERVLLLAPHDQGARRNLGTLRMRLGDLAGGRALIEVALAAAPNDPEMWFDRSVVRSAQGEYQGAADDATRALELGCSRPAFAHLTRATARWELGERAAALMDLHRARELAPQETAIGFNLALTLLRGDDPRQARQVCDEVLASAQEPRLLALRARAHLALGDPPSALRDAEAALHLAPELEVAWLRRGLARKALGLPGAAQDLEHYLALAPTDEEGVPQARAALAELRALRPPLAR